MAQLSIGTVVKLNGGNSNLMIIGYSQQRYGDNNVYDYLGCLFPEGYVSSNMHFFFMKRDIEEVIFEPYSKDNMKRVQTNSEQTENRDTSDMAANFDVAL